MTPDMVAIRRPVWVAMSDLFLDTDVRIWYACCARVLAQSPFTLEQLDSIFKAEVRPALVHNLCSIAGEWAGFDEQWLVSEILARRVHLPSFGAAEGDWQAVRLLVGRLRLLDVGDWPRRVAAWEALSKLFLHRDARLPAGELLEEVWRSEMWPAYGHSVDAHWRHSPGVYPSREEIEDRWRSASLMK